MTLTRFGEIKRNINLCNNDTENIRDQERNNPAYKFDPQFKALVENTNTTSAKYDENQVIDESY